MRVKGIDTFEALLASRGTGELGLRCLQACCGIDPGVLLEPADSGFGAGAAAGHPRYVHGEHAENGIYSVVPRIPLARSPPDGLIAIGAQVRYRACTHDFHCRAGALMDTVSAVTLKWRAVCKLDDLVAQSDVVALVDGVQIALFYLPPTLRFLMAARRCALHGLEGVARHRAVRSRAPVARPCRDARMILA